MTLIPEDLKLLSIDIPPATFAPGWYPAFITAADESGDDGETLTLAVHWSGREWQGVDSDLAFWIYWAPDVWTSREAAKERADEIVESGSFHDLEIIDQAH